MKYLVTGGPRGPRGQQTSSASLWRRGEKVRVFGPHVERSRRPTRWACRSSGVAGDVSEGDSPDGLCRKPRFLPRRCRGVAVVIHSGRLCAFGLEAARPAPVDQRRGGQRNVARGLRGRRGCKNSSTFFGHQTRWGPGRASINNRRNEESALPGIVECPLCRHQARGGRARRAGRGWRGVWTPVIVNPGLHCSGPRWDWKAVNRGKCCWAVTKVLRAHCSAWGAVSFCDCCADGGSGDAPQPCSAAKKPGADTFLWAGINLSYWDAWAADGRSLSASEGADFANGPRLFSRGLLGAGRSIYNTWITGPRRRRQTRPSLLHGVGSSIAFSSRRAEQEIGISKLASLRPKTPHLTPWGLVFASEGMRKVGAGLWACPLSRKFPGAGETPWPHKSDD